MILRIDGRRADQLREVRITRGWLDHAEGFQSAHAVAGEGARDAVAGLNALQGQ